MSKTIRTHRIFVILGLLCALPIPAAAQGVWSSKAPMPTARADTNAVVVDNKLYVIGGTKGEAPFGANEEYDPVTDRWRVRAPLPRAIHHHGLATTGGKIYAFGGFTAPA